MHFPQNVHAPQAKRASRNAIEDFAEEIAHRYDFHQTYQPGYAPEKLHRMVLALIEKMGGRIFTGTSPAPKANPRNDSLVVFATDDFMIAPFANSSWTSIALTQAVTNAAEIGHVFLHYPALLRRVGSQAVMICPRHPETPEEMECDREARWFAEALIFPRAAFHAAWDHHKGDPAAVAHEYSVTEKLVASRAARLGYIVPDLMVEQMPSRHHRIGNPMPESHVVILK